MYRYTNDKEFFDTSVICQVCQVLHTCHAEERSISYQRREILPGGQDDKRIKKLSTLSSFVN